MDKPKNKVSSRKQKKEIFNILESENWKTEITQIIEQPGQKLLSILFSGLYNASPAIRWHSISSFGILAANTPKEDIEKLRIIMRRCIWNLTEEAGSLAWGAPEVMGEIMANNEKIAKEYYQILFSYIFDNEDGPDNYLEFDELRKGVFWGIARLCELWPDMAQSEKQFIIDRFELETEAEILAILCRIAGLLKLVEAEAFLNKLKSDRRKAVIYHDESFNEYKLSDIAELTLDLIKGN